MNFSNEGLEVLTAVSTKNTIVWDVTPYRAVYKLFEGTY
jgi:hypothetical protein